MITHAPSSLSELSEHLRRAHQERLKVRVAGRADRPPRADADVILSLADLQIPIEHEPGDLVAALPAGITLAAANAALQRAGQWLPLDPPGAGHMTIGALVAANASGPRRHRYGSPRDLIIGIDLALSDGRLVKAGGRVVKNVAGYDLARLMCGSFGSLAIVTRATFKLVPVPPASLTVVIGASDARLLGEVLQAIAASPLTPSAVEAAAPPCTVLVRFETTPAAAQQQAEALRTLLPSGAAVTMCSGADERALWNDYEEGLWGAASTVAKVSVLPSRVTAAVHYVLDACTAGRIEARIGGRGALGVLYARLDGPDAQVQPILEGMRRFVAAEPVGAAAMVTGDSTEADRLGDSWPLMQAVKTQFDPHHLLNPGGGPGCL